MFGNVRRDGSHLDFCCAAAFGAVALTFAEVFATGFTTAVLGKAGTHEVSSKRSFLTAGVTAAGVAERGVTVESASEPIDDEAARDPFPPTSHSARRHVAP